jgi:hypothetical protein
MTIGHRPLYTVAFISLARATNIFHSGARSNASASSDRPLLLIGLARIFGLSHGLVLCRIYYHLKR